MIIKVESYKIFSEIYCPIMPAPLELFFGDGCRSVLSQKISAANRLMTSLTATAETTHVKTVFIS